MKKAVQEQKIGQLLQENEAIEKEMAELSKTGRGGSARAW